MKSFHIYRYNDSVALSLGGLEGASNGVTVYLTMSQASKLSKAIKDTSKDIGKIQFTKSTLPGVRVDF